MRKEWIAAAHMPIYPSWAEKKVLLYYPNRRQLSVQKLPFSRYSLYDPSTQETSVLVSPKGFKSSPVFGSWKGRDGYFWFDTWKRESGFYQQSSGKKAKSWSGRVLTMPGGFFLILKQKSKSYSTGQGHASSMSSSSGWRSSARQRSRSCVRILLNFGRRRTSTRNCRSCRTRGRRGDDLDTPTRRGFGRTCCSTSTLPDSPSSTIRIRGKVDGV